MHKVDNPRVLELLLRYVEHKTHTGTELENNNINFFKTWFEEVPYLKENPSNCGFYPIKNDPLKRNVCYAMLKGTGNKTVVMIHHTDTVDTDDYGKYKEAAYHPYDLEEILKSGEIMIDDAAKKDLESGEWLFGRGASDMKSGGSVHLAIFEEFSKKENFEGNLIILGVPDEENSSAGMRAAVHLLKELKEKYNLDYILMLNGEPHERIDENKISLYDGSAGKIMPVVYVRGKLAHVGQIFKGLNPISVLSEIVRNTELNPDFIEKRGNTATLPPTWLYFKDNKEVYDVSLPLSATGYMSVLTLYRDPFDIMEDLKKIAKTSFVEVLKRSRLSLAEYTKVGTIDYGKMEWEPVVLHYGELLEKVIEEKGEAVRTEIKDFSERVAEMVKKHEISRIQGSNMLIEKVIEYWSFKDPVVVLAMSPPYYPATSNSMLESGKEIDSLIEELMAYSKEELSTEIEVQNYFTGISDLSYAMFNGDNKAIKYIEDNMLLWGKSYTVPLAEIRDISMPVLNIGSWGKDLHKYTERILIKDLTDRVPKLTRFTLNTLL
ncbi:MAG: M20/M25/M40 family metallo-hydrolase [Clostridiaceae bacterium]